MINSSKAIAANTDLSSAQSFIFETPSHTVAIIISASYEDIFIKIKQAVTEIESQFYDTTKDIPEKLNHLETLIQDKLKHVDELTILVAAWSQDVLYLQSKGPHFAFLFRDNQQINLITPSQQNQLVSGHILPADKILLGTNTLQEIITDKTTDFAFLIKDPIADFQDQLNVLLLDKPHLDPMTAILIEVKPAEKAEDTPALPASRQTRKLNLALANLLKLIPILFSTIFSLLANHRKLRLASLAIMALIFFIGAIFIFQKMTTQKSNTQLTNLLTQAQVKYDTAQSLKDLNATEAKNNLDQAKRLVDQVLKLDSNNSLAKNLKSQIDSNQSAILKVGEITDWPLYLSLDLIKPGFTTKSLSESVGQFLMLDTNSKSLVLLDVKPKSNQILAGSRQLGEASFASLNGDFAFTYSPDKGVVRIDSNNQKDSVIVKPDTEWGRIDDIYAFGSNVYLLDSAKNQIWKYVPVAAGYSEKFAYLKANNNSLSGSNRLQIDSSVWVLKDHSSIDKFTSGSPDFFSISGLDRSIKEIPTFFVSYNTDNVYIIDSTNSRLVIVDKTGKYVAQYTGDKFKTATDLVVDEKAKQLYLLEGNKIYLIDLK